jgi:Domain of unknown function (DUF4157)
MHAHDHDSEVESLRPKGARLDQPEQALVARAAAEGRWGVVGSSGMAQLQRAVGNSALTAARSAETAGEEERSPVHDVVSNGGGRALEPEVRADMESRLGHDFGDVRVHNDGQAHDSAVAVNAHAYTVGSNIVFQRDRYDPSSTDGQVTLAHELTHVVQQRNGPVDGTPAAGGIKVSDPGDRFEREAAANADRVMSTPTPIAAAPTTTGPAVQREADEEHEVQGSFEASEPAVQREGEEEEEVQGSFTDAAVQREGGEEEEEPAG